MKEEFTQEQMNKIVDDALKDLQGEQQTQEQEETKPQEEKKEEQAQQQTQEEIVVEIDGEKIPLEELKKGYMRSKHYTQRLNDLAEKSKELEYLEELAKEIPPDKIDQIKALIRGDQNLTQEQKDAMEEYLEGLDPDDPVAKTLGQVMQELQEIKKQVAEQSRLTAAKQQEEVVNYLAGLINSSIEEASKGKEFVNDVEREIYNMLVLSSIEAVNPNVPVETEDDVKKIVEAICDNVYDKIKSYRSGVVSTVNKSTVQTGMGNGVKKSVAPSVDDVIKEKGWQAALDGMIQEAWKQVSEKT